MALLLPFLALLATDSIFFSSTNQSWRIKTWCYGPSWTVSCARNLLRWFHELQLWDTRLARKYNTYSFCTTGVGWRRCETVYSIHAEPRKRLPCGQPLASCIRHRLFGWRNHHHHHFDGRKVSPDPLETLLLHIATHSNCGKEVSSNILLRSTLYMAESKQIWLRICSYCSQKLWNWESDIEFFLFWTSYLITRILSWMRVAIASQRLGNRLRSYGLMHAVIIHRIVRNLMRPSLHQGNPRLDSGIVRIITGPGLVVRSRVASVDIPAKGRDARERILHHNNHKILYHRLFKDNWPFGEQSNSLQ